MKKMKSNFHPSEAHRGEVEYQEELKMLFKKHGIDGHPKFFEELYKWKNY
jgi:hypothetical protein